MKQIFTFILSIIFSTSSFAQIGGGWDWAYNTGSYGHDAKYIGYNSSGDMLIVARTNAASYLGSTTVTVPDIAAGTPGQQSYLAKISATGIATIIRSFPNPYFTFNVATTDAAGNFYVGMSYSAFGGTPIDLGNGVTLDGLTKVAIVKFSPTGTTLWAKSFDLGVTNVPNSTAALEVLKIALSPAGNIFFVGAANNVTASPGRFSIFKLDGNGNTIWTRYSSLTLGSQGTNIDKDKFIDNDENVYLSSYGTATSIVFNGETVTAPTTTVGGAVYSFYMSLDANGNKRWTYGFRGAISNLVVDKPTGNVYFGWLQSETNGNVLAGLQTTVLGGNPNYFNGIVKCNSAGNLLLGKSGMSGTFFIPISGNRLLMGIKTTKTVAVGYGVDYFFPADAVNETNLILETDANLEVVKAISGGNAVTAGISLIAAFGDTYGMVANFNTSNTALPTCVYGNTTLTGFNSVANFATVYPSPLYTTLRSDQAYSQCKSANFPVIGTTTWLGTNTNWNNAANWTNGIPTNAVKAVFNSGSANYPSSFTSPTSGTLQVNPGAVISLPPTISIAGAIKNEGTIKIDNAGFFQGFGATEWKGNGTVEFLSANAVNYFYAKPFTNAIILNSGFTTYYDMALKGITFNTTSGKFNMNAKVISITDPLPTSLTGTNSNNYLYGGTLQRAVNATGSYEFPLGSFNNFQSATVDANGLAGVSNISATHTSGAVTGTAPNTTFTAVAITSALNGGWFSINPNAQPTAGTYNITLKIKGSTNTATNVNRYAVIKRNNSTSAWAVNGSYVLATTDGTTVTSTINSLTSFSDFAIGIGASSLPVSLTGFAVKANNNKVHITWQTASEINNKGFNLLHSVDGSTYNSIGFVAGKGNSNAINNYSYTHPFPVKGNNYYKLEQMDFDGKKSISETKMLAFAGKEMAVTVYPNPVVSSIHFSKLFVAGSRIQIINSNGTLMEQGFISGNTYKPKQLAAGMYKVVVMEKNTNSMFTNNILVQ